MTKTRVHPHLTASAAAFTWADWRVETDGVRAPVPPLLLGWDYAQALRIGTSPRIDVDKLRTSTGLTRLDDVMVVVTIDCPGTSSRFVAGLPVVEYASLSDPFVAVDLDPGSVALELRLACHLVLLGNHQASGAAATASGSRLAESPSFRVVLEGEASRFPTEAVSFGELGLEHAAWSVKVGPDDLNESFAGCVRLMLNVDNRVGAALASMDPATYASFGDVLRMDIVRAVVHVGLALAEVEDSGESYDEDSFGGVVERMCEEHFRTGLTGVRELRKNDIERFERLLQSSVDLGAAL